MRKIKDFFLFFQATMNCTNESFLNNTGPKSPDEMVLAQISKKHYGNCSANSLCYWLAWKFAEYDCSK